LFGGHEDLKLEVRNAAALGNDYGVPSLSVGRQAMEAGNQDFLVVRGIAVQPRADTDGAKNRS
jgi:hypothetical protein